MIAQVIIRATAFSLILFVSSSETSKNRAATILKSSASVPGGGGILPYMGYIGMCGPKGYSFSAVLVINRVSIIAILPPLW